MITITNLKIAGFEPKWARFHGFSLLFDNPNNHLQSMQNNLFKLHCSADNDPDLIFYKTLSNSLNALDLNQLLNTYLFCSLVPSSFHVTVLDGLE